MGRWWDGGLVADGAGIGDGDVGMVVDVGGGVWAGEGRKVGCGWSVGGWGGGVWEWWEGMASPRVSA
ncbi:hypothetical protein EEL35_06795 [Muribaculaceae bacterium Isolate-042 (Harlan)]|jgi:hypothetical protein|uniref:Uncharacterized protein n=1 Tax=Muribaculum intestinale TaxID=1796646 RepID=A0A1B1SCM5_9BACT|nr:hypothetical protein A4V02_13090 [Muribaculum intestinale]ASB37337.1 hypothetical protein ADH68_04615 [Muribaculum intestinale]PWB00688.1 hypothetical protein C5O29_11665 [Muribaculum intestinale]PWB07524.1 hypothetical protein C5O72_12275 [Muribaculum intestinale]ROS80950.1 hypothetical protein EEL35_06795 [Muribaculaceae bacterium Isolate-042 (Harlan)]